jgi:outer membrane biosynthesis protein TonB
LSHLNLGRIFDLTNQRSRAAVEYRMVLATMVNSGVTPPETIEKSDPVYPPEAALAGLEGSVVVSCIVDEKGHAQDVHVEEPVVSDSTRARCWQF